MNITAIIVAAIVVGCVGIVLGLFLGISGEKFKVEVDPKEEAVLEVLPGNNCGGCGYAGCSGLAAAIAKGEAPIRKKEMQQPKKQWILCARYRPGIRNCWMNWMQEWRRTLNCRSATLIT